MFSLELEKIVKSCKDTRMRYTLFVVTDGKLQVPWYDTLLLVIARGVASKLENFGREVFEDGREVN